MKKSTSLKSKESFGFKTHAVREAVANTSIAVFKQWATKSVVAIFVLAISTAGYFPVSANHDPFNGAIKGANDQIDLCHNNNGVSDYSGVQAKAGSIVNQTNNGHPPDPNHGGDIIPPFHYDIDGVPGEDANSPFPGRNWNSANQDVWNSNGTKNGGCKGDGVVGPTTGSITITKNTGNAANNATFTFTKTSGPSSIANFQITTSGGTGSITLSGLAFGTYVFGETQIPTDWAFLDGTSTCDNGVTISSTNTTASCTMNNTYSPVVVDDTSTLTLVKTLAGDQAPDATSAWTLTATGGTNLSGQTGTAAVTNKTVLSGTYQLGETGPTSGYTASWDCNTAAGADVAVTSTNMVTLVKDANVICTVTNTYDDGGGQPQDDVTVTIVKYVDGSIATANSTGSASFSMSASWNATNIGSGNGNFELDADGFLGGPAYQATTSEMTAGASYSVQENLDTVCGRADDFALVGYSVGDSLSAAAAAQVSASAPALTNITTDKFIIVHNTDCEAPQTYSLSGKVFNDENENGILDENEAGLEGWTVYIDSNDDDSETGEDQTTTSSSDGSYSFNGLEAGCYIVREVVQNDWTQTSPDGNEYEVAVGDPDACDPITITGIIEGLLFNTAHAVGTTNTTGLNFGNSQDDDSSSGGGSRSGSSSDDDDDDGRILGDTTSIPYVPPTPQVAGATTLPVTGSNMKYMWALLGLMSMIILPASIARKMKEE